MGDFLIIAGIAAAAALASPLGGWIALKTRPNSLMLSIVVGLAGGVLIGTFAFEMMPEALARLPVAIVVVSFAVGFGLVYALDLYLHRGKVAGPEAEENGKVERFHKRHRPRGSIVTVIGSATASEEIIEGITLGAGAAVNTSTAIVIGIALIVDNISEAMSLGALALDGKEEKPKKATMWWTSTVGVSLFVSAMAGWFILRGLPQWAIGALLALGAGAMFNLTIADMIPEADSHQYQRSSAIATAGGFLVAMVLANLQ
ncbi:zinc/iron permease [Devosia geojensis]|uniref:Zinc/iron permease n=1 Tax=Devosia geojensis TaxID=443610 RepID=A0A0F5FWG4_9HYPH|nr:ZIP family metal transporter [Devosia geojensis]KKB12920.1 zinc/iron permease [Devosia geojensis]